MIESTRIKSFVEIGDRVLVSVEGATYSGFIQEIGEDGVVLEWRDTEIMSINGLFQEGMVTKRCFVDRETIKDIIRIK